jgi:hypothetical protein
VLPLAGLLALAVLGLGSAVGLANPLSKKSAHVAVALPARGAGLAGAIAPLSELRSARLVVANPQGSTEPSADASALPEGTSAIEAASSVAQAIAPNPSPVINPLVKPAVSVAAVAAAVGPMSLRTRGAITIETFGYSFGPAPGGCAFVADVRNIDAGKFAQTETGLMPSVRERVMATSAAQEWLSVFRTQWAPALKDGDKVAIGCARGHHRSVTLGVLFAEDLRAQGYTVNVVHRDILKTW